MKTRNWWNYRNRGKPKLCEDKPSLHKNSVLISEYTPSVTIIGPDSQCCAI